jgi:four helix bundle protein
MKETLSNTITTYRDLIVWQKSFALSVKVYELTKTFPQNEMYGLTNQMRRAAISIPSNIAEGYRRSKLEYKNFLRISFGSASELETQLLISNELKYCDSAKIQPLMFLIEEVLKMLNVIIRKIS